MFHIVYKTTNNVNGKVYIGVHSTQNISDGYIGSGLIFKRAVKKYGKQSFSYEIVCFCESKEQAFWVEAMLVDKKFVLSDNNYNTNIGGASGRKGIMHSESTKELMSRSAKGRKFSDDHKSKISLSLTGRKFTETHKNNISIGKKLDQSNKGNRNTFSMNDTKEKIRKTNIERYGSENPFSNDFVKEKIKQTNLQKYGVYNTSQLQSKLVSFNGDIKTALEWSRQLKLKYTEIGYKANLKLDGFEFTQQAPKSEANRKPLPVQEPQQDGSRDLLHSNPALLHH